MTEKRKFLKAISDKCPKDGKEIFLDKCENCKYRGTIWHSMKGDKEKLTVTCYKLKTEAKPKR